MTQEERTHSNKEKTSLYIKADVTPVVSHQSGAAAAAARWLQEHWPSCWLGLWQPQVSIKNTHRLTNMLDKKWRMGTYVCLSSSFPAAQRPATPPGKDAGIKYMTKKLVCHFQIIDWCRWWTGWCLFSILYHDAFREKQADCTAILMHSPSSLRNVFLFLNL